MRPSSDSVAARAEFAAADQPLDAGITEPGRERQMHAAHDVGTGVVDDGLTCSETVELRRLVEVELAISCVPWDGIQSEDAPAVKRKSFRINE